MNAVTWYGSYASFSMSVNIKSGRVNSMVYPISIWLSISALETRQVSVFIFAISFCILAFSFFLKVLHIFPTIDFSIKFRCRLKRSLICRRSICKFSRSYKNEI